MGGRDSVTESSKAPRLCRLVKWPHFQGYGFNLHSEKGREGQFIGKIDAHSPAEACGLCEGDRIYEVNGVNISNENHRQVVERIKSDPESVELLVLDADAVQHYKDSGIVVTGDMENVLRLQTPPAELQDIECSSETVSGEEVSDAQLCDKATPSSAEHPADVQETAPTEDSRSQQDRDVSPPESGEQVEESQEPAVSSVSTDGEQKSERVEGSSGDAAPDNVGDTATDDQPHPAPESSEQDETELADTPDKDLASSTSCSPGDQEKSDGKQQSSPPVVVVTEEDEPPPPVVLSATGSQQEAGRPCSQSADEPAQAESSQSTDVSISDVAKPATTDDKVVDGVDTKIPPSAECSDDEHRTPDVVEQKSIVADSPQPSVNSTGESQKSSECGDSEQPASEHEQTDGSDKFGLKLNMTAAEMKQYLKSKKRPDPRNTNLTFKQRHEIVSNM